MPLRLLRRWQPTDFSFPLAAWDDTPTRIMKYLMIQLPSVGRVRFCALSRSLSSFPIRLVQPNVSLLDHAARGKLRCRRSSLKFGVLARCKHVNSSHALNIIFRQPSRFRQPNFSPLILQRSNKCTYERLFIQIILYICMPPKLLVLKILSFLI